MDRGGEGTTTMDRGGEGGQQIRNRSGRKEEGKETWNRDEKGRGGGGGISNMELGLRGEISNIEELLSNCWGIF